LENHVSNKSSRCIQMHFPILDVSECASTPSRTEHEVIPARFRIILPACAKRRVFPSMFHLPSPRVYVIPKNKSQ
jgi:hypothetical protein